MSPLKFTFLGKDWFNTFTISSPYCCSMVVNPSTWLLLEFVDIDDSVFFDAFIIFSSVFATYFKLGSNWFFIWFIEFGKSVFI